MSLLHEKSQDNCKKLIDAAIDAEGEYVLQVFTKGKKHKQDYYDFENGEIETMTGRVRLTPYFSVSDGIIITVKSTMCPNTDYIHASTNSINSSAK